MKRLIATMVGGVAALGLVGAAFAQGAPTPEQQAKRAAENRHAFFHTLGYSFGPVGGMLRKQVPFNAAAAGLAATRVEVLAGMIKDVTAADTSKIVTDSEAKANIWTERADFDAKADALVKAAGVLKTAAAAGDEAATTKAMQGVGGACKSCHDKFRQEKS